MKPAAAPTAATLPGESGKSSFESLFRRDETMEAPRPVQIVYLAFDVTKVTLPLDDVRDARKVWNHIEELRVEPVLAVLLARNGLRVGVGSPQAWPAIRVLLDAAQAHVTEERLYAQANAPVTLPLAAAGEAEPIFTYGRDGRLRGQTFDRGEKRLGMEYQVGVESPADIALRLTFDLRQDLGVGGWENVDGAVREVPAFSRHVFEELRPIVTLMPGEFVVVGLGETAEHPYLLGNQFLAYERSGEKFEMLLFVSPTTSQMAVPATAGR